MTKWINVKKKLPIQGVRVLTADEDGWIATAIYTKGKWQYSGSREPECCIIYWADLPIFPPSLLHWKEYLAEYAKKNAEKIRARRLKRLESKRNRKNLPKYSIVLKGLRYREGLTQKKLAEKLGCSPYVISNWETGICNISKSYKEKLVDILNTNIKMFE